MAFALRGLGLVRLAAGNLNGAAMNTRRALELQNSLPTRSVNQRFEIACCHATLSGLAGRERSGMSPAEGPIEAEKAMQLLKEVVQLGLRDPNRFRIERALDPLRPRDDFKKLMKELEPKNPAPKSAG